MPNIHCRLSRSVSNPESWKRFTEENIRRALGEISQSDELMNKSDQLLAATGNDMWSQWNQVNVSLENRVQEEHVARHKIQGHLEKVCCSSLEESPWARLRCARLGHSRDLRHRAEHRLREESHRRQGSLPSSRSDAA